MLLSASPLAFVVDQFGWRAGFWVSAGFGIAVLIAVFALVPRQPAVHADDSSPLHQMAEVLRLGLSRGLRGLIAPNNFIPVAEETGLIVPLGEIVLRKACFEAAGWPADIAVAVNLSPVQFKNPNLVSSVRAALDASGLSPDRLELEITE